MDGAADVTPTTLLLRGQAEAPATAGGKGAMLDRLIGLGAAVPTTGVVTTWAYRRFVADGGLLPLIDRLRRAPPPSAQHHDEARRVVDDAFLAAPMAPELERAILDLATRAASGRALAVRSSATAEDLASASFAGQYRSMLEVAPEAAVEAVRLCWASLWHPTPRTYRHIHGLADTDLAMAVLFMPMLRPSTAGVLFTEDPTTLGALRIESVDGLGEQLVPGSATPSIFVVDRRDVGRLDRDAPELAPLATTALEFETHFGFPLDVEWAIEGGKPFILQARPITTVSGESGVDDGFDSDEDETAVYTTAGIAEMLPGVLPPRLWEMNSLLIEEALRRLFVSLGADLDQLQSPHALVARFGGRAALDLDRMESVVASIPGGSVAELEHQYFGDVFDPGEPTDDPKARGAGVVQTARTLRQRGVAYRQAEVVLQAIERILDLEPDLTIASDVALLAFRARLIHMAGRAMEVEVSVASTASAGYRSLEIFLRRHLEPDDARLAVQRLTIDHTSANRGSRALDIDALGSMLGTSPAFPSVRELERWGEARATLERSRDGRALVDTFLRALRRAGSTTVFGGPTWDEVPELVWPSVRRAANTSRPQPFDQAEVLAEVEQQIGADAGWRFTRAITGQVVDVRRRFLRREAKDAVAFLRRREHTKAALLMLGGVLRRVDLELGSRLERRRVIESAGDIEFLTGSELRRALIEHHVSLEVVARRRRRHDAALQQPPLPRAFEGDASRSLIPDREGDHLQGWAASPGRFEGPAAVVDHPRSASLRRGDVLVTRTTDASWLPLFHVAGAAVVEEGGPLSHAAILARELGMPAVVNVPGIVDTMRSRTGAMITVDGASGTVTIHDRPAPTGSFDVADGIAPPRVETPATDRAPGTLHVFMTGLIGAGTAMSIVIGLTQAIGGARTQERIARRAEPRAATLAAGIVHGFTSRDIGAAGLRSRAFYRWVAILTGLAAVLAVWSVDDYIEDPSSIGAVWLFPFGISSGVMLAAAAGVAYRAASSWPLVSPSARRWTVARVHERLGPAEVIGARISTVVASLLLVVAVLAWMVAEAEAPLLVVDEWVFDAISAGRDDGPLDLGFVDHVLQKEIMVGLAVALTLLSHRCRTVMFVYPLVIAGGGLLHLGLAHFIHRARPPSGPKPWQPDSFPGGHVNELTIMLGLLPLVLYVLTGQSWTQTLARSVCWPLLALVVMNAVRVGDHWPSDNLAGLCIGLSMVLIAHGAAASPEIHDRCRGCPAQRQGDPP